MYLRTFSILHWHVFWRKYAESIGRICCRQWPISRWFSNAWHGHTLSHPKSTQKRRRITLRPCKWCCYLFRTCLSIYWICADPFGSLCWKKFRFVAGLGVTLVPSCGWLSSSLLDLVVLQLTSILYFTQTISSFSLYFRRSYLPYLAHFRCMWPSQTIWLVYMACLKRQGIKTAIVNKAWLAHPRRLHPFLALDLQSQNWWWWQQEESPRCLW